MVSSLPLGSCPASWRRVERALYEDQSIRDPSFQVFDLSVGIAQACWISFNQRNVDFTGARLVL